MDERQTRHQDYPIKLHDYEENEEYHPRHTDHKSRSRQDIKTYLSWTAPGRPFRKKGKEYYYSVLLISVLFEIIFFMFSQYQLMLVVGALVFLSFALASVPPHNFHYRISSEGVKVEDHFYIWRELYDFYFKKYDGVDVLIIRTQDILPGELKITLGDISREHIRQVLVPFLPYREYIKPTFMEKSGDWLSRTFPLEKQRS